MCMCILLLTFQLNSFSYMVCDADNLEGARAVLNAAEKKKAPIILQVGCMVNGFCVCDVWCMVINSNFISCQHIICVMQVCSYTLCFYICKACFLQAHPSVLEFGGVLLGMLEGARYYANTPVFLSLDHSIDRYEC
ncbi:hypothetical protein EON63_12605 [archaeon]|nr:MAG: hypothetical protein EON63_12605 [archaeon]